MRCCRGSLGDLLRAVASAAIFLMIGAQPVIAQKVRISGLSDVNLLLLDPSVNASAHQSICVFSNVVTPRGLYHVSATGSGAASAFTLSGGASVPVLPYTVEWSATSGSSTGSPLSPGVVLGSLQSQATQQACRSGPATSASLIVILQASDLQAALSGITYTGVLTILIGPN